MGKPEMTEINTPLNENEIAEINLIELLFFAYRDFVADPDKILEELDFGRAHHRVLYFVNRRPGMMVAELLDILGITKQSLARVLKQLVEMDFITQQAGPNDRRQRLLFPTHKGRDLIKKLSLPQSRRIQNALHNSTDKTAVADFLTKMIDNSPSGEPK